MSFLRVFAIAAVALFALVGVMGMVKKKRSKTEIAKEHVVESFSEEVMEPTNELVMATIETPKEEEKVEQKEILPLDTIEVKEASELDSVNNVGRLFTTGLSKFPFVETISYKGRVPWLQGRPAWIADYASHFSTSRHFIARSLNGKPDYFTQKVASGDRFNVFSKDVDLEFYLVVDLTKCLMRFYAYDKGQDHRYFIRTYKVGCGRVDANSPSGCLSPIGTFKLGEKVAIYKEGVEGYFKDTKVEMISVFGTRWIPYSGEEDSTLAMISGFGIHGAPWFRDETSGELVEDKETIGQYSSDGCIRLLKDDIEELFSIVITKPTTVQVVKNFQDAKLPGSSSDELALTSSN